MNEGTASAMLESLGHEKRLAIYRLLVRAGASGMGVGEVGRRLKIPGSTLSHHLVSLVRSGLVQQTRNGRGVTCNADYAKMDSLLGYLTEECCSLADEPGMHATVRRGSDPKCTPANLRAGENKENSA